MLHAFRLPTKSTKGFPIPFLVWQSLTLQLYHEAWHPASGEMLSRLKTGSSQFGVHRTWMASACATKTLTVTWRWFTAQWHDSHVLAFTHLSLSFKSTACWSTHQIFHRMVILRSFTQCTEKQLFQNKKQSKEKLWGKSIFPISATMAAGQQYLTSAITKGGEGKKNLQQE